MGFSHPRLAAVASTAILSAALFGACAQPAWASSFADVPADHWAETSGIIDKAVEQGIVKGSQNPDGTVSFRPDESITRAEVAAMLMRIAGVDEGSYGNGANQTAWVDVPDGAWYTGTMNWAEDAGILNGSGGHVRPNDRITRQELAVMLGNFEQAYGIESVTDSLTLLSAYPDASSVASWAQQSVAWCVENGIMGGGGALNPAGNATRAEAAKMVVVLNDLLLQEEEPEDEMDGAVPPADGGSDIVTDTVGSAAVEIALQFEGSDYLYGGASPEEGFDCSGLVMYAYAQLGISLPHSASAQLAVIKAEGRFTTDVDELQYGDLVFFPGHVAFYVGDGMIFGARKPGVPACTAPMAFFGEFLGGGQL